MQKEEALYTNVQKNRTNMRIISRKLYLENKILDNF